MSGPAPDVPAPPAAGPALVEFRKVCYRPSSFPGELIEHLDLSIPAGEIVVVTGPAGCGKSTVFNLACGALRPDDGEMRLLDAEPARLDDAALAQLRTRIGVVPQRGALLSNLSLRDNVALPLLYHRRLPVDAEDDAVARALHDVGIANLPRIKPASATDELRQLVALATALVLDPAVLILDEPLAGLTGAGADGIWKRIDQARWTRRLAVLIICSQPPGAAIPDARVITLPARLQTTRTNDLDLR